MAPGACRPSDTAAISLPTEQKFRVGQVYSDQKGCLSRVEQQVSGKLVLTPMLSKAGKPLCEPVKPTTKVESASAPKK
jgi:hypothetical protein